MPSPGTNSASARAIPLVMVICLLLLAGGRRMLADEVEPEPSRDLDDRVLVQAFFDGLLSGQLQAYDIAGAGLALVRNGEILLTRGYGLADAGGGRPVSAETTLFRMASISKLLTWTAVMQLEEQGRIDLRRDVNAYLDGFRIPDDFPQPVTLEHLMSHSSGFEDRSLGIGALRGADVLSLEDYLRTKMPRRIRPPGEVTAYCNYGTALAGYIVQRLTGRTFEEVIEGGIFRPLGMTRSSFRQPPPPPLGRDVSRGHVFQDGVFLPRGFEFVNGLAPAGSLSSTVGDMARFMLAHLEGGAWGGGRILREETVGRMHKRLFSNDRRVCGNAYGFWEKQVNGRRMLTHGGDTWLFHSQLVLIPEERTGLVVVYNTQTAASPARDEVIQVFMDRFFPAPPETATDPTAPQAGRVDLYEGWYGLARNPESTLEKALGLLLIIRVKAVGRQRLLTVWPAGLGSRQWVAAGPGEFHQVDGRDKLVFRLDDRGRPSHAFLDSLPMMAGVRLRGYRNPALHRLLLAANGLILLTTLAWPLQWLARRSRREKSGANPALWAAQPSAFLLSLCHIGFLVSLGLATLKPEEFLLGVPVALRIGLFLPLVAIPLNGASAVFTVLAWRWRSWTVCVRLHYTLIAVSGVLQLAILQYWNLLGFSTGG